MYNIIEMKSNEKIVKALQLIDNQTIKITFEDNIEIDVDTIKNAFDEYDHFTNGQRLKKLLITGYKTLITKEARQYGQLQMKQRKNTVAAEAFVVHHLHQKMVVNFYINFIKTDYPIKFFLDEKSAIEWLNTIEC
jgi:hypothetical protein